MVNDNASSSSPPPTEHENRAAARKLRHHVRVVCRERIRTKLNRYDVMPAPASWQIIHDGDVIAQHWSKSPAIGEGIRLAEENRPSMLVIHAADGSVDEERSFVGEASLER